MKLKSALKYSSKYVRNEIITLFSMFIFLLFSFIIIKNFLGGTMEGSGFEIIYLIFTTIICFNILKNNISMFLQNSLSRKTLYLSSVILLITLAFILTIFNIFIFNPLSNFAFTNYTSLIDTMYYINISPQSLFSTQFLFLFSSILFFGSVGYFLSILFYILNKKTKIILLFTLIFLVFLLPTLDIYFNWNIYIKISKIYEALMGTSFSNNLSVVNPFIGVITLLSFSTTFLALTFLLIRKVNLKKQ